jgi:hypothetical protein
MPMFFINGEPIKSTSILVADATEDSGTGIFAALENAGYRLSRASTSLDEAIQVLIENYPELDILINKLPRKNRQHPYLRIILAASLYKYLRYKHINLSN